MNLSVTFVKEGWPAVSGAVGGQGGSGLRKEYTVTGFSKRLLLGDL